MDINGIADQIQGLTLLEASHLAGLLGDHGISVTLTVRAAKRMRAGKTPVNTSAEIMKPSSEPATDGRFSVVLTNAGASKINVIKLTREVAKLGLKEAKELVDGVPRIVKENVSKREAEDLKKKFAEAGATVEIK